MERIALIKSSQVAKPTVAVTKKLMFRIHSTIVSIGQVAKPTIAVTKKLTSRIRITIAVCTEIQFCCSSTIQHVPILLGESTMLNHSTLCTVAIYTCVYTYIY